MPTKVVFDVILNNCVYLSYLQMWDGEKMWTGVFELKMLANHLAWVKWKPWDEEERHHGK